MAVSAGHVSNVSGKLAKGGVRTSSGLRAKTPLVLVVDDCEESREVFAGYLRYAGFNVEVAGNGLDAFGMALKHLPDVVLMDMHMPVMDGWDAVRHFKKDERTAKIPIIAVSAHVSTGDVTASAAGCDFAVPKPCPPQHLVTCVLRALSSARRAAYRLGE